MRILADSAIGPPDQKLTDPHLFTSIGMYCLPRKTQEMRTYMTPSPKQLALPLVPLHRATGSEICIVRTKVEDDGTWFQQPDILSRD